MIKLGIGNGIRSNFPHYLDESGRSTLSMWGKSSKVIYVVPDQIGLLPMEIIIDKVTQNEVDLGVRGDDEDGILPLKKRQKYVEIAPRSYEENHMPVGVWLNYTEMNGEHYSARLGFKIPSNVWIMRRGLLYDELREEYPQINGKLSRREPITQDILDRLKEIIFKHRRTTQ